MRLRSISFRIRTPLHAFATLKALDEAHEPELRIPSCRSVSSAASSASPVLMTAETSGSGVQMRRAAIDPYETSGDLIALSHSFRLPRSGTCRRARSGEHTLWTTALGAIDARSIAGARWAHPLGSPTCKRSAGNPSGHQLAPRPTTSATVPSKSHCAPPGAVARGQFQPTPRPAPVLSQLLPRALEFPML